MEIIPIAFGYPGRKWGFAINALIRGNAVIESLRETYCPPAFA
jgi:hypothetical protein